MKCPECVKEGLVSRVLVGSTMVTCLGWTAYYDEAGHYHSHNPNSHVTGYVCSRGHSWRASTLAACPNLACDYGKEDEIPEDSDG